MKKFLNRFVRNEAGATAIEYGLIASGVSIAILVAVTTLGQNLNTKFSALAAALN